MPLVKVPLFSGLSRHLVDMIARHSDEVKLGLERDLEALLNFLGCPKEHQRKVRTTNAIKGSPPQAGA